MRFASLIGARNPNTIGAWIVEVVRAPVFWRLGLGFGRGRPGAKTGHESKEQESAKDSMHPHSVGRLGVHARYSRTMRCHRPWARRINSMTSRTAPWPPASWVTVVCPRQGLGMTRRHAYRDPRALEGTQIPDVVAHVADILPRHVHGEDSVDGNHLRAPLLDQKIHVQFGCPDGGRRRGTCRDPARLVTLAPPTATPSPSRTLNRLYSPASPT